MFLSWLKRVRQGASEITVKLKRKWLRGRILCLLNGNLLRRENARRNNVPRESNRGPKIVTEFILWTLRRAWRSSRDHSGHTITKPSRIGTQLTRNIIVVQETWPAQLSSRPFNYCLRYFMLNQSIRPPLWSSGQSTWLQIRRLGFDSRHYQKKK
jgi:hypothetical protein